MAAHGDLQLPDHPRAIAALDRPERRPRGPPPPFGHRPSLVRNSRRLTGVTMRRLSVAQRTVVVIAWAVLLRILWGYLFLPGPAASGGWFGYTPLTGRVYAPHARGAAATAVTWGVATLVWAAASVWLFGRPKVLRLR